MRSHSYINSAKNIVQGYDGSIPFALWLKHYFKEYKKYGSRDRREIAHLCYSFYRLGNAFQKEDIEERILLGVFLSSSGANFVLQELKPEWKEKIHLSIEEKVQFLNAASELQQIFPYADEVSDEINAAQFHKSFLLQPLLYLRIRPGEGHIVETKLQDQSIDFEYISSDCITITNSTKVDEIIELNKEAVVQDYSSQRVLELLPETLQHKDLKAWDCCAASGGKSILLNDRFPDVRLTVTDVRKSILINLQKRFYEAGIRNYRHFVMDVSSKDFSFKENFDLVICDAPCSGSGTWSRTPEQLHFFEKEKINYYAALQKRIAANAAKNVKMGGYLLYITCSVFKKENEEVVDYLQKNTQLQLQAWQYFKGYDRRADTLFAALFTL
jgi:16S rRNA (cytosine967-C5)-methyltransferase